MNDLTKIRLEATPVPPTAGTVEFAHRVNVPLLALSVRLRDDWLFFNNFDAATLLSVCSAHNAHRVSPPMRLWLNEIAMRERPKNHGHPSVQIRCSWLATNMCQNLRCSRQRRLVRPLRVRLPTPNFRAYYVYMVGVAP